MFAKETLAIWVCPQQNIGEFKTIRLVKVHLIPYNEPDPYQLIWILSKWSGSLAKWSGSSPKWSGSLPKWYVSLAKWSGSLANYLDPYKNVQDPYQMIWILSKMIRILTKMIQIFTIWSGSLVKWGGGGGHGWLSFFFGQGQRKLPDPLPLYCRFNLGFNNDNVATSPFKIIAFFFSWHFRLSKSFTLV